MNALKVHLFGQFRLEWAGKSLREPSAAKAQELFCYLLLYPHRAHHRESLANILWADAANSQSKQYFRRALWQLHSALTEAMGSAEADIICVDGDWIQLNPKAKIWVDAIHFEKCCQSGQKVSGHQLEVNTANRLQEAIQLYQGDLLEGWYQEWCLFERERLAQLYLGTLDKLMAYCETSGAYETGITYGRQVLWHDRVREHTHRQMMRLYYLSGNRSAALQQYEQCAAVLAEELGVQPMPSTKMLYDQLCDNQVELEEMPENGKANGRFSPQPTTLTTRLNDDLKQLHGLLLSVQEQVQHQLEAVESVLKRHS